MRSFIVVFLCIFAATQPLDARPLTQRIGILAALPAELNLLKGALENARVEKRGDDSFFLGELSGISVALTLSGVGKVNAAIAAQRLISEFRVKALVVTGVAGGVSDRVNVGDIVIGSAVFQHDYGHLGESFVVHAVGTAPEFGMGTGDEPLNIVSKWPSVAGERKGFLVLVQELFGAEREHLSPVQADDKEFRPTVRSGVIATGDQFIANEAKKKQLAKLGADVVEMEGGAIGQVSVKNDVPFLIVRSVSDRAGEKAKIDFARFFTTVASNNALLVKQLFHNEATAAYFRRLR